MTVAGLGQCSLDHLFLVDRFPAPDTKKEIAEWIITGGGPVATALVSLSRLGVSCRFCGVRGDDDAGIKIEESLAKEGIDVSNLITRKDSFSQIAFIAVESDKCHRTIFWKRPSSYPVKPDEIPGDFLDDVDFLLLDGLMADASIVAAQEARRRNIPIMLDAGHVRDRMLELSKLCDYVVASEEFAREFTGNPDSFDAVTAIRKMNFSHAVAVTITLGSRGSITSHQNEIFITPAFDVDVVDTTGAGDVFHGGYIYGILRGWDIKQTVQFASAFAALKCRRLGGRAGIPSIKEVEELLTSTIQNS